MGSTIECYAGSPATATFQQSGTHVSGTFDAPGNPCGFSNAHFEGLLETTGLTGTVTGDRFVNATAQGTYKKTLDDGDVFERLTIRITDGSGYIPGGTLILNR